MESLWNFIVHLVPLLCIVVFIHEFGHFIVARWCGIKVQTFSVGFGREIWGFNDRYGTRWRLAWIPLGGYVKFIDDETAASTSSAETLDKLSDEDRAQAFQAQPLRNRALVVAAGPAFNIASAILIYIATFWLLGSTGTEAVVDDVVPGGAAASAGLKAGDKVTEIDGRPVKWFSDLQRVVAGSAGRRLEFVIERGGKQLVVGVTPQLVEQEDPLKNKVQVAMIGIKRVGGADRWEHRNHSLLESTKLGFSETGYVSWQIISSLPKLPGAIMKTFTGQRQSDLGGPLAIADMTAHASKGGVAAWFGWMAIFSIMLGIMNLLPIPILDGGHLMFYALEAVRGKPLDESKQELGVRIGMAILGTMMFAAIFGDIMRKLGLG